jgi:3-phenylpropionate/cinnamic acid dioxygenase small subunit
MKRWLIPAAVLLVAASFGAGYAVAAKGKVAGQISYEDRAAINDLMVRYSHYIDTHQAEAWASLFTADGELNFPGANPKGREALVKFATRPDSDVQGAHFVGNSLLVEVTPGRVHARSMIILGRADKTRQYSANFNALGVYVDDIVKTRDGWKFQSRKSDTSLPVTEEFLP